MYLAIGPLSLGSAKSMTRPMSETVRPPMMIGERFPIRSERTLVRKVTIQAPPYLPSVFWSRAAHAQHSQRDRHKLCCLGFVPQLRQDRRKGV